MARNEALSDKLVTAAEQIAEVGDPIHPECEKEHPQDDDLLPVADHPVRPGLHIAS